jgi:hypothetical protein
MMIRGCMCAAAIRYRDRGLRQAQVLALAHSTAASACCSEPATPAAAMVLAVGVALLALARSAAAASAPATCHEFPNQMVGAGFLKYSPGNQSTAGDCCDACGKLPGCAAWTWHTNTHCILKDNAKPQPGHPKDVTSGLHPGPTCTPHQQPSMCPAGAPCPDCGGALCPCNFKPGGGITPPPKPLTPACTPPNDHFKFCDTSLPVAQRVSALLKHIPDATKPNLLTARGGHGLQNYSEIGVPAYYWGTNCLHSVGAGCINGRCPTNFPSGPSMAATFDRSVRFRSILHRFVPFRCQDKLWTSLVRQDKTRQDKTRQYNSVSLL